MKVLIAYDVCTKDDAGPRRLRRVAQACQDYGQRVQKSLFECQVGVTEWVALRQRLLDELTASRIRCVFTSWTRGRGWSIMAWIWRGIWKARWWYKGRPRTRSDGEKAVGSRHLVVLIKKGVA